jgi:hypothetical protein
LHGSDRPPQRRLGFLEARSRHSGTGLSAQA